MVHALSSSQISKLAQILLSLLTQHPRPKATRALSPDDKMQRDTAVSDTDELSPDNKMQRNTAVMSDADKLTLANLRESINAQQALLSQLRDSSDKYCAIQQLRTLMKDACDVLDSFETRRCKFSY